MRPLTHLIAIVLGIAAPVLFTLWTMTDYGPRSRAHYEHAAAMDKSAGAVARRFVKLGIEEGQPQQAARRYFAPNMQEHGLPQGAAAGGDRLMERGWGSAQQRKVLNLVAEGDKAVVQQLVFGAPGSGPPHAEVDIFRIANGKIVEHWEVIQSQPAAPPAAAGKG